MMVAAVGVLLMFGSKVARSIVVTPVSAEMRCDHCPYIDHLSRLLTPKLFPVLAWFPRFFIAVGIILRIVRFGFSTKGMHRPLC